ncbi:hypothetical protein AN7092.2 [Aspergillus terreus]|uniref:NWD NACHT-NTPase N-terminal domain-containing protein n=1 Tax=Aspergillus terreus TaxID=33178 RepID=A0A5M3Z9Y7_ASPTE|nr:hypothetical protein ATETN484_0012041200 [Aspergillus terreus]GFF19650.1 hypothetical protein AN7092.2 [Aspergillus terreus]
MSETAGSSRHGLGTLVEGYIRRRLRHDVHPALEGLRDNETQTAVVPQAAKSEDGLHATKTAHVEPNPDTKSTGDEDDPDLGELYRDAMREQDRFREAMEAYEQTTAGSKFKTDVTSKSMHTWEEVLEEVNRASETYHSRATVWGKIRAGLHKLGDNSKVFDAWAGLLPSGSDCATVISGGLKLILAAAARLADLRHGIADALEEIPSLLTCIHQALNIFKRSKELHRCSAALYVSTLALLHHIVSWYRTKAIKKLGLGLLRQDAYEAKMDSLLQGLRTQSERFDKAARLCSYEAIEQTRQISIQNQQTLNDHVDRSITQWDSFQNEIRSGQASTQQEIHAMQQYLFGVMERFLGSHDSVDPKTGNVRGPMLPSDEAATERRALQMYLRSRDHAFTALGYTPSTLEADLTTNLDSLWTLPLPSQDRIIAAMQSPKLHTWITTPASSTLFINMNTPGTSPSSSFLPAKLVQSITAQPSSNNIYILAFFCSAHTRSTDPDAGPSGMMRNLIGQLLQSHPGFDLSTVTKLRHLRRDDVHGLCEVFHELIRQLPDDVIVFCIVDGVTEFEDRMALKDTGEEVVRALVLASALLEARH